MIAEMTLLTERLEKIERLYRVMLEDHVTLMHQMEACEDRLSRLEAKAAAALALALYNHQGSLGISTLVSYGEGQ
jgi:hypothetical protein